MTQRPGEAARKFNQRMSYAEREQRRLLRQAYFSRTTLEEQLLVALTVDCPYCGAPSPLPCKQGDDRVGCGIVVPGAAVHIARTELGAGVGPDIVVPASGDSLWKPPTGS